MITVANKPVPFYTIKQDDGTWGYWGQQNESLDIIVKNQLNESSILHWHGLILPNNQDGVDLTQAPIGPESSHAYQFPLIQSGTYWIHDHHGLLEQNGVEAPLIIQTPEDKKFQQVVVMFQDFSFKSPHEILTGLQQDDSKNHHDMASMNDMVEMKNIHHENMTMDLNDVAYDAYLTNYYPPEHPQIVKVSNTKQVKLRFINGAAGTNFWINLGKLKGTVVAIDGNDIKPINTTNFPLAIGQRADIIVEIPAKGGTFPIIGQVEGMRQQTGLILTTTKNKQLSIPIVSKTHANPIDYQYEKKLHSLTESPLINNTAKAISLNMILNGTMKPYQWTINNQSWPNITPIIVNQGDLVNLTFDNQSMMEHPMHLHGYKFKVINIDGKPIDGAIRDTVMILPHSKVTIQFVANNPGKWMLHCHLAYHMHSGMMTYLEVKPKDTTD